MSMWLEDLRLMDAETLEDLCDEFEEKIIRFLNLDSGDQLEWLVEPKFDGVSASLLYEDGVFVRGAIARFVELRSEAVQLLARAAAQVFPARAHDADLLLADNDRRDGRSRNRFDRPSLAQAILD